MFRRLLVFTLTLTTAAAWLPPQAAVARSRQAQSNWLRTESPHFEIHYLPSLADEVVRVVRSAERAYEHVSARLDFSFNKKVPLVMWPTTGSLTREEAVAYSISDAVAPQQPHRSRITLPVPDPDGDLDSRIVHELTHLLVGEIILPEQPGDGGLPRWVQEGIAHYMVGTWSDDHERLMRDMVASRGVPSLSKLSGTGGFRDERLNDVIGHAAFDCMESRWGRASIRRFVNALIVPRVDKTYAAVLDLTPAQFDAAFRQYAERRFTGVTPTALAQARPPNVVLVLIDDYGWADTGSYGSTYHRTPNIDALAARGMRFTAAYAAAPVCSPTRAALLTGKHPARLHLTDWLPGRGNTPAQKLAAPTIRQQLPLEETTLAEALKPAGYTSAHIGKWHLGGAGFEPEQQGFELNVAGDETGTPLSYFAPFQRNGRFMPKLETAPPDEYLTDRLTTEAEHFIEQNRDKPFFLYLAHYAVHIPMKAKAGLIAKYRAMPRPEHGQNNPVYAAMIESIDESVGRLVRKLEQSGLAENSVLIFTADNGGLSAPEGPDTPATDNAPLRAGKGYLYEGGLRVPLIVAWPRHIDARSVNHTPVYSADLFATVLAIAGVKNTTGVDGMSLLPLLTGRGQFNRDALYWHYPHYSNQSVNDGHVDQPGGAIRQGDYKLIEFYQDNRVELYDLKNDQSEQRDLARSQPQQAAGLRQKLAVWRQAVGAQMMTANPLYNAAK